VGTKVLDPLRACLISSAGILTHVKMIETCVESILLLYPNDAIAGHFFYFSEDD
jgi:hypothetical protein